MGLKMILENVKLVDDGLWGAEIAPHQVQLLGSPKHATGMRTVLLADSMFFDEKRLRLEIDLDFVSVLNLGTTRDAVIVSERKKSKPDAPKKSEVFSLEKAVLESFYGPGDREFIRLVERLLEGPAKEAALRILQIIRADFPGDLQKGQRLNFKNTRDNFWYVIVQPRVQGISITVRGLPNHFFPSSLTLKMDRPGYTRFSVKHPEEIEEAVRIIKNSRRNTNVA